MSQPCRQFIVTLSIAHQEFCLHLFDHSGAIHSLGYSTHKFANLFLWVIYVLTFGNPGALIFDTTFIDPMLSPSLPHQPSSGSTTKMGQIIYIHSTPYAIIHPIFISCLIWGRAASSWLVKKGKKFYVIKDYWTHRGRKFTEDEILKKIVGLLGIPELVESWMVQIKGVNKMTDLLWPAFLAHDLSFETCIHQHLLMMPVDEPLVDFSSLQELVSVFIDIIHGKYITILLEH